jgi:hypothetical protein
MLELRSLDLRLDSNQFATQEIGVRAALLRHKSVDRNRLAGAQAGLEFQANGIQVRQFPGGKIIQVHNPCNAQSGKETAKEAHISQVQWSKVNRTFPSLLRCFAPGSTNQL